MRHGQRWSLRRQLLRWPMASGQQMTRTLRSPPKRCAAPRSTWCNSCPWAGTAPVLLYLSVISFGELDFRSASWCRPRQASQTRLSRP